MYILVVDDDARMAAVLARLFQQAGWRSDIVATAYEGIDCALSHAYDCAVVDVELPDGSGIDMVCELRRLGVHVPILILTVHDGLSDRVAGLTAGADDYLGKPFAPEELMARIQALVRRGPMIDSGKTPCNTAPSGWIRRRARSNTGAGS